VGGEVVGISAVSVDVTEENGRRKELVATQAENERRLGAERGYANAVIESLPGVFYHYGGDMRLQRWNTNLERITGHRSDELLGFDPLNFFFADEQEKVARGIQKVMEHGAASFEAAYRLKDGTSIPDLFTGVRF
jgi:PAS domain S-box-containing protein